MGEAEGETPETVTQEPVERATGTVKWFNATKGFGFITPDVGGEDLFVHQSSIEAEGFRSLREGEPVEFVVEASEDGRTKAVQVTGPEGGAPQGAPRRVYVYTEYPPPAARGGYGVRGRGRGRGPPPVPYVGGAYAYPPPARGGGRGRVIERRPPPGTPGVSSGFQVVVHNLPWSCTWQNLKDAFQGTGNIERADVIIDSSGRSRGFGTVKYATPEDAIAAVEKMNNQQIGGRTVTVRIDRFA